MTCGRRPLAARKRFNTEKSVRVPANRRNRPRARGAHKARDPAVDDAVSERCAGRQYPQRCPFGEDVCSARVRVRIVLISFRKRIF